jgi:hypothetical protein
MLMEIDFLKIYMAYIYSFLNNGFFNCYFNIHICIRKQKKEKENKRKKKKIKERKRK